MFFTADQIVAHMIGDYVFQSHHMATNKTKNSWVCLSHCITYALPFVVIMQVHPIAFILIVAAHYPIDRYRLARYVIWFKNGAKGEITDTGFPKETPVWLSTWLLIIVDNILHLICNAAIINLVGVLI